MPQLEQISTFPAQIFWLFVSFAIIYLFLAYFVVPRLGKLLEAREDTISSDINTAELLKNNAVVANTAFEKKSAGSRSKAVDIITAGTNEANSLYDKGIFETDGELKKQMEASEKEINAAKTKVSVELEKSIPAFVEEVVNKLAEINTAGKKVAGKIVSK